MKITCLARALKCGALEASGLADSALAIRVHRSASARKPKPHEAVLRIWRRDRPRQSMESSMGTSVQTKLGRINLGWPDRVRSTGRVAQRQEAAPCEFNS